MRDAWSVLREVSRCGGRDRERSVQSGLFLWLKGDEREIVDWQADSEIGSIKIQDTTKEFDVDLEGADFIGLYKLANQWNGWPVAEESLALQEKLDSAA